MSINVTVSGNPVYVKKGTMVSSNDPTKLEFDKRRLIRLEQVRQQSKDIAANIRDKLKKDKVKKNSDAEQEGEITLKNWQARKLLDLQNQYQDALSEMGLGHKQADKAQLDDEIQAEQQEVNDIISKERGRAAAQQLQSQKNQQNIAKSTPGQRKKLARDTENRRASLVTRDKTPNKKKKVARKTESTGYDSESENRVPQINLDTNRSSQLSSPFELHQNSVSKLSKEQQTGQSIRNAATCDKEAQTQTSEPQQYDTRISDRIMQRLYPEPQTYTCFNRGNCTCCPCPQIIRPCNLHESQIVDKTVEKRQDKGVQVGFDNKGIQTCFPSNYQEEIWPEFEELTPQLIPEETSRRKAPRKSTDKRKQATNVRKIPAKPKVTLISSKDPSKIAQTTPVQHYDHSNRYTKQQIPTKSYVERIDMDNIEMTPLSEEDLRENMRQKDIEAQKRGQAAMEKQKIEKEYKELMKKLPVLQKQERIAGIGLDKEHYHMSDSRAEEREKQRQNRMENAYEDAFIRPNPITLPRINKPEPKTQEQGVWDGDFTTPDRTAQLNAILAELKAQRHDLLREIKSALSQETLAYLGSLLKSSSSSSSEEKPSENASKRKRDSSVCTEPSTKRKSSPTCPRKKAKRKVLVLQNTSTQTTPKPGQSAATSPILPTKQDSKKGPCTCKSPTDDLCEIVIKIQEENKPKVSVHPAKTAKNVQVQREEQESMKSSVSKGSRDHSWRQHFSHSISTSSTSYMDPPDTYKSLGDSKTTPKSLPKKSLDSSVTSNGSKQLDRRLLTYIKKLLDKSRGSIEDLTVSGVSNVSTPSQSVIDLPTNNPLQKIESIIKYYKLNRDDLQAQLQSFSESPASTSPGSELDPRPCAQAECNAGKTMTKYADMAEACARKISNLTEMIEKVREEKRKIIESTSGTSGSDKDSSTKYLELPKDSSNSAGEDELDKKLLEVDYSYAEQLKQLTGEELAEQKAAVYDISDEELMGRLKKLLEKPTSPPKETPEFTPMLDIPKLPKLDETANRRPPPSKGLRYLNPQVALIPHELSTIAEADSALSTKVDSPAKTTESTHSKKTESSRKKSSSSSEELETVEGMLHSIGMEWAIPTLRKTREALALSSSESKNGSSGSPSMLSDAQELSVIQADFRRTSTPVQGNKKEIKESSQIFSTSSNISSVKDYSDRSNGIDKSSEHSSGRKLGETTEGTRFGDLHCDDNSCAEKSHSS